MKEQVISSFKRKSFFELIKEVRSLLLEKILGDKLFEKVDNSKIMGWIFTIFSFLCLFFFYQLGYSFLYGYFFGGINNDSIPIIDMFVNPVPFNLKSVVGVGVFFLAFNISFLFPVVMLIYTQKIKYKLIYACITLFTIVIMVLPLGIVFIGNSEGINKTISLILILISTPVLITLLTMWLKYAINNALVFLSSVFYTFIIAGVCIIFSDYDYLSTNKIIFQMISFFCVFILPSILCFFAERTSMKMNKYEWFKTVSIIILYAPYYFFGGALVLYIIRILKLQKYNLAIFVLLIALLVLVVRFIKKKKSRPATMKENNKEKKIKSSENNKDNDNNNYEDDKKQSKRLTFVIVTICFLLMVIIMFTFPTHLVALAGRIVRESLYDLSESNIEYSAIGGDEKTKTITGKVVAQADNTYYISKFPEWRLFTINSSFLYTSPCEELKIPNTPYKLVGLINDVIDNNVQLMDDKDVKVEVHTPTEEEINNNRFNYTITIKTFDIDNKGTINYQKSVSVISILVKYSLADDDRVEEFLFGVEDKYSKDYLLREKNENFKNINKFILNLETSIFEYLNISDNLDEYNNKVYYTNGVLQYEKLKDRNSQDTYIEMYYFNSNK